MSIITKSIILLLFLVTPVAQATVLKCVGMYSDGDTVHVIFDDQSMTLNLDGDVHKIETTTENKKGLVTADFNNQDGEKVYLSFVNNEGDIYIKLFKSKNDDLIETIHLGCTKQD